MESIALLELGPRERARIEGIRSLGDVDLVAILLGTGTPGRPVTLVAAELLASAGGLVGLARDGLRHHELSHLGIGEAKRARLEAAVEIGQRAARLVALRNASVLSGPLEVAAWARAELSAAPHEELWVVAVDARNALLAVRRVSQGGTQGATVTARDILRVALRAGASAMILVHNHPSGDPKPSVSDARLTVEVARAAKLVGTPLLDHVIVAGETHASLFSMGLLDTSPDPGG
jgi:DNA repair protein RadC